MILITVGEKNLTNENENEKIKQQESIRKNETINDSLNNEKKENNKQYPLLKKITSTKVLKKIESEKIFRNVENILHKEGDFYIRIVPPTVSHSGNENEEKKESLEDPIEESNDIDKGTLIHKCCICFDKIGDAVLMECGHGGFSLLFKYLFLYFFRYLGICYDCAIKLWKKAGACFMCRTVDFIFTKINYF